MFSLIWLIVAADEEEEAGEAVPRDAENEEDAENAEDAEEISNYFKSVWGLMLI